MKKKIFFICFMAITVSSSAFAQMTFKKEYSRAPGTLIDINIETGAELSIEGWDRETVLIEAEVRRGNPNEIDISSSDSRNRINFDILREDSRRNRNRNIRSEEIKVEIKVPRKFDLRINVIAGDVIIRDLEGKFRGEVVAGNIEIVECKGYINMSATAGRIEVRDCELDGKVATVAGDIRVRGNDGNLKESTLVSDIMGSINLDIGKEISRELNEGLRDSFRKRDVRYSRGGEIRMERRRGRITIDEALDGADLSTGGGDIRVRYAEEFIKAETEDGDIIIDELDGWIDALTYDGDIEVKIVEDNYRKNKKILLETYNGDIELEVPGRMSMDIDIEIVYSEDSKKNYKIESDFDIDTEESRNWERPRRKLLLSRKDWDSDDKVKSIRGTGKTRSGENKIVIKAVNGNVTIKRNR